MIERFIANLMIHWKAKRTSHEAATTTFATEGDSILKLLHTTPKEHLTTPFF